MQAAGTWASVQAVRGDSWEVTHSAAVEREVPPPSGWIDVALPDTWSARWPEFSGVVWYRLRWHQQDIATPVALLVDYLSMAGAIYVNGSLLERDAQLTEPLSRAWNRPRYVLLPAALLRPGDNSVVLRVSGFAEFGSGIGRAEVGPPAALHRRFSRSNLLRQNLQLFSLALSASMGTFFLAIWLLRRRNAVHGWFALLSMAWCVVASNQVVTSPWPFTTTDAWSITTAGALVWYIHFYTVFVLRFCGRRWPCRERWLWAYAMLCTSVLAAAPHLWINEVRSAIFAASTVQFTVTNAALMVVAWRHGHSAHKALAACAGVLVASAVHDLLAALNVVDGFMFYAALTSQLQAVAMGFVLAHQFATNLNHIEGFNAELARTVAATRAELTRTLQQQHERQIANAHLVERQHLAHDLHDGLGGTLVSTIAALEHVPHTVPPQRFLAILKELRDDLRLVVEAAGAHIDGNVRLADQIAALRHRMTQRLAMQGIVCHWSIAGLADYAPPSTRGLQILRLLQEALMNVFQHSHASRVEVSIYRTELMLCISVHDDGVGFDPGVVGYAPGSGAGVRSLQARARRLGGTLNIRSTPGSTVLEFALRAAS